MDLTIWQTVGVVGTFLFSARWLVQIINSHSAGKSVVSRYFWYLSITGNLLVLLYFVFGARDFIGILSNSFPLLVAGYNLYLTFKEPKVLL